ncbi:hypothetical protein NsoK4_04780 [Nitrosopumilus sp. K4]|uniref:hypothetical protein n=1 Tax=Nitrosopumilus sp. K4 TaxID=2795383 RepID=UPI001BAA41A0|nr:hypothetical protein [Nitrosopumilus sp. K4]QUC65554.1 hypothetical protein NsoK4_04780 [Nitrosopumilus sp. K4]
MKTSFDNDSRSEIDESLEDISHCYNCLRNDSLCSIHSEMLKIILYNDIMNWFGEMQKTK